MIALPGLVHLNLGSTSQASVHVKRVSIQEHERTWGRGAKAGGQHSAMAGTVGRCQRGTTMFWLVTGELVLAMGRPQRSCAPGGSECFHELLFRSLLPWCLFG
ncbi:unnamed protein product [Ostreobium quekettii]|uniref:Uncharacterized protein n=1 Tax=Ostreobium quekettii TaxID=121088 RepID=A0A8S1IZL0_9CHLO|nr:unnamed protein product [Ostreobium quekettii]|eukprot:evm.model.scf_397.3 EVM.evm.TU.scf_397.3   scf_397:29045-29353(-)